MYVYGSSASGGQGGSRYAFKKSGEEKAVKKETDKVRKMSKDQGFV